MSRACFWKTCHWRSNKKNIALEIITNEITKRLMKIEKKKNDMAQKKHKEIQQKHKKLNDIFYLFSRVYKK